MKIKFFLFICSFFILSAAYAQKVLSLHSLFAEQDAMLIPRIEGLWSVPYFDMTVSFQKTGDNFYLLKYGGETNPSTFEAVFVKIKNELYLDLNGVMSDTLGDEDYRNSFVNVHSLYKIRMSKDTLQLSESNYSWFFNYATKKNSQLKYEWVNNAMLLTYETDELKLFISENSNDPEIFNNPITLISNHDDNQVKGYPNIHDSEAKSSTIFSQQCIPEFPLGEGWLGGDGDVSVPINATTTLFIFSDTWVGNKNQQSRMEPGMRMVSNSVAVQTCLPNGDTDVKYFWNNKYSENPEPIFKTFTKRYKFWVTDAFLINDNLYVLLEKVGPKLAASPNDVFNFSLLGYTLAKIGNPSDTPNKWKIEYIPVPDFKNPVMSIGPHVKLENYMYFFINRYDKAQVLIRKKLDFIENTEKPFEYYALNKTWKEGLDTNDMDTLVNGFRSTTVNYHPEMKQWVMICDVKFMDNKIKMRIAPELTGPWSDEIDIYEIPEVTPGNSSYSESNFCYLPRECIQNYDSKRHVMLITYDINNPNFSEINANPNIYTPKVITIQLK
ncbi:hypothetical protein U3A58_12930 [Algoriphagus sp. C2-6-M1]|uniref:hypothetical protein n=1 Tax=Algoriphagus persicinus TaxID=3108754 RepID=UPI002B399899|nr:hypothetical protein [Algoriphagus sp. C2-6-M1]MEB2781298.1 hypothetical protein [Algoriphagus sp. C2-6-M1]